MSFNELIGDNGEVVTEVRASDGFVNATKICNSAGRLWADFYRNRRTKKFLESLSSEVNLPIKNLVDCKWGAHQGTWVHPRVCTYLAQWISVEFSSKVTKWLETAKETVPSIASEYNDALIRLKDDNNNDDCEARVREKLASEVRGEQCVIGLHGEIDIVSPDEVIEVKRAGKYLHALGQVLGHGKTYPTKRMRVHLFGTASECCEDTIERATELFSSYGVTLTYEIVNEL